MKIKLGQPRSFWLCAQRENQEDYRFPNSDEPQSFAPFFLVCDGVGGCEKGEVASRTVCEAFGKALSNTDWQKPFTLDSFQTALNYAVCSMQKASNSQNKGMATTLTFAAFHEAGCTVAHIGDSRIYWVRPNVGVLYRSNDHSFVNAMVHSGNLAPEAAIHHPDSNIITRCIRSEEDGDENIEATVMLLEDICPNDYIFLCSDGVLEHIDDDRLLEILSLPISDKEKIDRIAASCQNNQDNSTAYLIPIESISNVEKEDVDEDESSNNVQTIPFNRAPQQAHEIKVNGKVSFKTVIKNFIKKVL